MPKIVRFNDSLDKRYPEFLYFMFIRGNSMNEKGVEGYRGVKKVRWLSLRKARARPARSS